MACSLVRTGAGSYSAATNANLTINLISEGGAASIVTAMAFQHGTEMVDCEPTGDSFDYKVVGGLADLIVTFQLSGADGSATLVEDCGDGTSKTLAIIPTDETAGLALHLRITGS